MSIDGGGDSSFSSSLEFQVNDKQAEKLQGDAKEDTDNFLVTLHPIPAKTDKVAQQNLKKEPVGEDLPVSDKTNEVAQQKLKDGPPPSIIIKKKGESLPVSAPAPSANKDDWVNDIFAKIGPLPPNGSHITIQLDNFPTSKYTYYTALQKELDSIYTDIASRPTIDLRLKGANAKEGDLSFGILGGLGPGSDADILEKVMKRLDKKGIKLDNVNIDLYCCPRPESAWERMVVYSPKVKKFLDSLENSKFGIASTSGDIDYNWYSKRARSGEAEDVLINLAQEIVRKVASEGEPGPKKLLIVGKGSEAQLYPKALEQVKEKFAKSNAKEPDITCDNLEVRLSPPLLKSDDSDASTYANAISKALQKEGTFVILTREVSLLRIPNPDDPEGTISLIEYFSKRYPEKIATAEGMLVDRIVDEIRDNVDKKSFFEVTPSAPPKKDNEEMSQFQSEKKEIVESVNQEDGDSVISINPEYEDEDSEISEYEDENSVILEDEYEEPVKPQELGQEKPKNIFEELGIKPGDFIFNRYGNPWVKRLQKAIFKKRYVETHVAVVVNVTKDKIMMLEALDSGVCLSTLSIEQFKRSVGKGIDILKASEEKQSGLREEIAKVAKSFAKYYMEQKAQGNLTEYSYKHVITNFLSSSSNESSRIASAYTADSDHVMTSKGLKRSKVICTELATHILKSALAHLNLEGADLNPKHVTPAKLFTTLFDELGFRRVKVIKDKGRVLKAEERRYEHFVISPET